VDRRRFAVGVGAILLGVAVLLVLAEQGSVRHPAAAAERTTPGEFLAIGAGLVLLAGGVVLTLVAYVADALER
jgi:hypothetical protein